MARGRGSFGLSSNRSKRGLSTRFAYRGAGFLYSRRGRGRGRGSGSSFPSDSPAPKREDDGTLLGEKFEKVTLNDEIDAKLGFSRVQEGPRREGWLINMRPVSLALMFVHLQLIGIDTREQYRLAIRKGGGRLLFYSR